jgi:ribosome assembly protein YihI (activator of Der GTPase)
MDKKTPHVCKSVNAQTLKTVQELPQTAREAKIEQLAVERTAQFSRIADALEQIARNDNQNIADGLYFIGESIIKLSQSLQSFTDKTEERIQRCMTNIGVERNEAEHILKRVDSALNGLHIIGEEKR